MKEKVICTLAVGHEANRLALYAIPLMKHYANKVDADFIKLCNSDEASTTKPHYRKFQVSELLKCYKRVIFFDVDVLITPNTPNLFALVPDDSLGIVNVSSVFNGLDDEISAIKSVYGYTIDSTKYFNTGVMVIPNMYAFLFQQDVPPFQEWIAAKEKGLRCLNDQTYINYYAQSNSVKLFDLGAAYNFTRAWGKNWKRFNKFVIHYAGLKGNREKIMSRDFRIINNIILFRLFSSLPIIPFVVDRVWVLTDRLCGYNVD